MAHSLEEIGVGLSKVENGVGSFFNQVEPGSSVHTHAGLVMSDTTMGLFVLGLVLLSIFVWGVFMSSR